MAPIEEFAMLVANSVNLSPADLETEEMGEICAHYFDLWSRGSKNPMFIDMCVEAIYAAL